jgi:hypothetical protein
MSHYDEQRERDTKVHEDLVDELKEMERESEEVAAAVVPVKSDGGSSSYYQLELMLAADKIKEVAEHPEVKIVKLETGDIIRALVDNDFDLGNIIKAIRRIHQAKKGTGKAGTDVEYDCKKIEYFLKEWYSAYAMEQL